MRQLAVEVRQVSEEFHTVLLTDELITVKDIKDGHVWTYKFGKAPDGSRIIIGRNLDRTIDNIHANQVGGRAERYAERQALKSGKINRSVYP